MDQLLTTGPSSTQLKDSESSMIDIHQSIRISIIEDGNEDNKVPFICPDSGQMDDGAWGCSGHPLPGCTIAGPKTIHPTTGNSSKLPANPYIPSDAAYILAL